METFFQILTFISALAGLFFIPGLVLFSFSKKLWHKTNTLEKLVFAFLLGVVCIDFFMMISGRIGISFSQTLFFTYGGVFLVTGLIRYHAHRKKPTPINIDKKPKITFSKKQHLIILVLIALTVFIKTVYFSDTAFPTSTDLGHHLYWVNRIAETQNLPVYEKREIIQLESGYTFSQPKPIADFIIGEHLPFAAWIIATKLPIVSTLPVLFLFLLNLLGVLAVFMTSIRFFLNIVQERTAQYSALCTLFLAGPLYAIASPQAKYASGGVIGNIFGNLFIPVILLCFFRAWNEKSRLFAALGTLFSAGLFYTHHLSGLILLFIIAWSALFLIVTHIGKLKTFLRETVFIFVAPQTIAVIFFVSLCVMFVHFPSYLNVQSIGSAVGEPEKSTRTGIELLQLISSSGEARFIFGLFGAAAITIALFSNTQVFQKIRILKKIPIYFSPLPSSFLLGWFISLFLMSWKPQWLFLNLPSGRIANYLSFPLIILGGLGLTLFIQALRKTGWKKSAYNSVLVLVFAFLFLSGYAENAEFLKEVTHAKSALQTFDAAHYLAQHVPPNEEIIKDHNYVIADSWIKLFFNRGYDYPLSRAYFRRYEDAVSSREQCTLHMISAPDSPEGKLCYNNLRVRYVMVNRLHDALQFEKNDSFWKIFENEDIALFSRNQ